MAISLVMKLTLEFLGTFLLMLSILVSGGSPLIIGLTLALIVYLIGALTGAYVNPALTIAALSSGSLSSAIAGTYVVAQTLGAVAAAAAYKIVA